MNDVSPLEQISCLENLLLRHSVRFDGLLESEKKRVISLIHELAKYVEFLYGMVFVDVCKIFTGLGCESLGSPDVFQEKYTVLEHAEVKSSLNTESARSTIMKTVSDFLKEGQALGLM